MIVIADDITGAAEIAGMAAEQGRAVRVTCAPPAYKCDSDDGCITVIATDTRSMTEADAAAETRRIASFHIYKKTDSALRGHVVAELASLMEVAGYRRAVYLPANPSKGRIIRKGVYYIDGKPIHETAFSYDPEFPARTSVLSERFPDAEAHHIIMPDAESLEDVRRVVEQYDDGDTLFAGAADLFMEMGLRGQRSTTPSRSFLRRGDNKDFGSSFLRRGEASLLILCGSTQSKPLNIGIPVCPMPREVYDGEQTAADWFATLKCHLSPLNSIILTIPHTHRTGKETAIHLRTTMAEMARRLVERQCPHHLIIEGGATAWATLQALGWTAFEDVRQIAPGVVQMKSVTTGTWVTLKPGSYPWGGLFDHAL